MNKTTSNEITTNNKQVNNIERNRLGMCRLKWVASICTNLVLIHQIYFDLCINVNGNNKLSVKCIIAYEKEGKNNNKRIDRALHTYNTLHRFLESISQTLELPKIKLDSRSFVLIAAGGVIVVDSVVKL